MSQGRQGIWRSLCLIQYNFVEEADVCVEVVAYNCPTLRDFGGMDSVGEEDSPAVSPRVVYGTRRKIRRNERDEE